MSLILFHAGHNQIGLVSQHLFPGKVEDGWSYRVGDHAIGHFEVVECRSEGLEFQIVRWLGAADGRILLRGGFFRCALYAVIEGSCRIGWDGAGRQFHERAANVVDGINGFLPLEKQTEGRLLFIRIGFNRPAVVQREMESGGWCFTRNLMVTKAVFEMLTPVIVEGTIMPEPGYVRVGVQSLVAYLFSDAPLVFQRTRISLESAVWFYEQKRKLSSRATFAGEFRDLVREAGVENMVRFRRLLKQLYGYRPRDLLREQRMVISLKLLRETDLTVKEVAALSGYKNVFYFTRVFTGYFREPPGAFQRRHRR